MSGYDEAVAWFRADPGRVRDLDDVDNRSAAIAIVDAVLAFGSVSPDDAHTTTKTTTQYIVMTTRPNGEPQKVAHEGRDRAIVVADSFDPPEGWGPAWVECIRTVSTTTRTTDWKADES